MGFRLNKQQDKQAAIAQVIEDLVHAGHSLAGLDYKERERLDDTAAFVKMRQGLLLLMSSKHPEGLQEALVQARASHPLAAETLRQELENCVSTLSISGMSLESRTNVSVGLHLLAMPMVFSPDMADVRPGLQLRSALQRSLRRAKLIGPTATVVMLPSMPDCEQMRRFDLPDAFRLSLMLVRHYDAPGKYQLPDQVLPLPYAWRRGAVRMVVFAVVGPVGEGQSALCSPALALTRSGTSRLHEVEQLWMRRFEQDLRKNVDPGLNLIAPPSPVFCAARLATAFERRLSLEQLLRSDDVQDAKVAAATLGLELESDKPQLVLSLLDKKARRLGSCWASVAPFDSVRDVARELSELAAQKGLPEVRPLGGMPLPSTRPVRLPAGTTAAAAN